MRLQSPVVTTLYGQIQELALAEAAMASGLAATGRPLRREIRGRGYWYWSGRVGASAPRAIYLGPDDEQTRALAERLAAWRTTGDEARHATEAATRAFVAAGGMVHQPAHARVFEHLAAAGLFRKGVFVVGSHAFLALGNLLGVRWDNAAAATLDVDQGRADEVALAVPVDRELIVDLPEELKKLDAGFAAVPGLDPREPSTSILSWRTQVKVDFVTVQRRDETAPVFFPDLNLAATPLRFLDYLLGGPPARGLLVGRRALAVPLPDPARFALHKLIVSAERPTTFAQKAAKDRRQAAELLKALVATAPGALGACSALNRNALETPVATSTPAVEPVENTTDRLLGLLPGGGPPDPKTEPDSAMRYGLLGPARQAVDAVPGARKRLEAALKVLQKEDAEAAAVALL